MNITVGAVNDAPVNTVPAAQSTNEDTPLVLTAAYALMFTYVLRFERIDDYPLFLLAGLIVFVIGKPLLQGKGEPPNPERARATLQMAVARLRRELKVPDQDAPDSLIQPMRRPQPAPDSG